MAGGGSSELKAVLVQIRQLDARLTACEKDLIKLARKAGDLASVVEAPIEEARAGMQSMGIVGAKAKGKARR